MNISGINRNDYRKQNNLLKPTLTAGLSWFVLDMGVSTLSDVYYNHQSTVKLSKKILQQQTGKNALYASASAAIFAPILGIFYNKTKEGKKIDVNDISSLAGIITFGTALIFRLFAASRPHPKWKGAFSKFTDMFL